MERVELLIEGMSCGHCVAAVRGALDGMEGVQLEQVEVGQAWVAYDPGAVDEAALQRAVEAEGFTVRETRRAS